MIRQDSDGAGGDAVDGGVHVGIIMDGNGRWAEHRGLPRESGHLAGYRNVLHVTDAALDLHLRRVTLFAFSTENWARSALEIRSLMAVFTEFFRHDVPDLAGRGVRTRAMGRIVELPAELQSAIADAAEVEPPRPRIDLMLALAYGGRAEIADALRRAYEAGDTAALGGDERALERYLYAPEAPPPDLVIRTGGQRRLSNFMLWQAAYSELWFTDTLWPDFGSVELEAAVRDFTARSRTYGACPAAVRAEGR